MSEELDQLLLNASVSTDVKYASDIHNYWTNIPIKLKPTRKIYKLCEVAIKLGLGNYDFQFELTHGESFGNLLIPVNINIYINFVLDGIKHNIATQYWYAPNLQKDQDELTRNAVLNWWNHNSKTWELKYDAVGNGSFETMLRNACINKLMDSNNDYVMINIGKHLIEDEIKEYCESLHN